MTLAYFLTKEIICHMVYKYPYTLIYPNYSQMTPEDHIGHMEITWSRIIAHIKESPATLRHLVSKSDNPSVIMQSQDCVYIGKRAAVWEVYTGHHLLEPDAV